MNDEQLEQDDEAVSEPEDLQGDVLEADGEEDVNTEESDEHNAPVDHEQEENPDPDFDDSFESASVTKEQTDA